MYQHEETYKVKKYVVWVFRVNVVYQIYQI